MRIATLIGLVALVTLSGCAGVLEFQRPAQFKDAKVKEDPPGTLLPVPRAVMPC